MRRESYSGDYSPPERAACVCGGQLSFDTDLNGYVIETCDSCGMRQPMNYAPRRSSIEKPVELVDPIKCADCPTMIGRTTRGMRRLRCNECTQERQRSMSREWNRRNRRAA